MFWIAAFFIALSAGLPALLYLRLLLGRDSQRDESFVTVHISQESAVLKRRGHGPGQSQSLAELIRSKVPALGPNARFNGVWWLPGGDAQTMYCSLGDFSKTDPVVYERHLLELADQGIIAIDVTPPLSTHPISNAENILFVAHGLTGGSHEAYVRAVLSQVTPKKHEGGLGFRAVVLNFRGCNGSPVVTPRLYHAGSSDDIRPVMLWICHTFPDCNVYGIGFSLGANILTKYAQEEGERCAFQALVTLANPWDFVTGCYYLPSTLIGRHVYRYVLGGALRALLHLHRRTFVEASVKLPVSVARLEDVFRRRRLTLKQYDDLITAPLYGYEDAIDYYGKISSSRRVGEIRVPCLSINSADDPITGGTQSLPIGQVSLSPYLALAVTKAGGHLGWFERAGDGGIGRWYVKPVQEFLGALVEYGPQEREKPRAVDGGAEFVWQDGRDDVGFRVLSREKTGLVVSGTDESRLFSGW